MKNDLSREWRKLNAGQRVLNFAWGFGFLGIISCLIGMSLRIDSRGPMEAWLGLCFFGCIASLIGSIITYKTTA